MSSEIQWKPGDLCEALWQDGHYYQAVISINHIYSYINDEYADWVYVYR
jgi:hypothetical protein